MNQSPCESAVCRLVERLKWDTGSDAVTLAARLICEVKHAGGGETSEAVSEAIAELNNEGRSISMLEIDAINRHDTAEVERLAECRRRTYRISDTLVQVWLECFREYSRARFVARRTYAGAVS